jgi:hypothetical protein
MRRSFPVFNEDPDRSPLKPLQITRTRCISPWGGSGQKENNRRRS